MSTVYKIIISVLLSTLFLVNSAVYSDDGKLSVSKGAIVNASAADVWAALRDFNAMEDWHPAVIDSFMVGSGMSDDTIRFLILSKDARIVEQMTDFSDENMYYSYIITDSPLPLANYAATLSVNGEESNSQVIWKSTFDAKEVSDQEAIDIVTSVYSAGLESIVSMF